MDLSQLLLLSLVIPLLGALAIAVSGGSSPHLARGIALVAALATLGVAGWVTCGGSHATGEVALTDWNWLGASSSVDVKFSVGLDGLSLWMYGLSALLSVTAILVSWTAISERQPGFYALLLILETGMLGVFAARDLLLFYIFFEFTLIPLFFLIGIWGSEDRKYAAVKFFLFTLAGSLLTFVALLAIVLHAASVSPTSPEFAKLTFSIPELLARLKEAPLPVSWQWWIFLGLFAGFAIKVPLFPLHTWLPLAHVQAPTAGSVILAGILLKIGTYGFVRFSLPMLPDATVACMPWVLGLSVAGIIYGALVALAQSDIKRLIAYSSVSHLGFCMLGIFALNKTALTGGLLQMINHGLSTGGLFAVVGMIYERYHTRQIDQLGGLARRLPWLTFMMLLFTFSSIGLPGLNGFVGEFLVLTGMFQRGWVGPTWMQTSLLWIAVLSVTGVVLGAWYMLYLVQRVFYGPLYEPAGDHGHGDQAHGQTAHGHASDHKHDAHGHDDHGHDAHSHDAHGHHAEPPLPPGPADMNCREFFALAPLVIFMFWIGLKPQDFTKRIDESWKYAAPAAAALEKATPPTATQARLDAGVTQQTTTKLEQGAE
jgi:NADH-quinone oxidoreductase subunit M